MGESVCDVKSKSVKTIIKENSANQSEAGATKEGNTEVWLELGDHQKDAWRK